MLRSIWLYRGFIAGSVKREIQSRYLGSLLGAAWVVINPLALILVYTLVFSHVMRAKLPGIDSDFAYSIYLCAGLLPWTFFAEVVNRTQSVFIDNANLIKKSNFPRVCLPTIILLSASFNFAVVFALFLAFLLLSGHFPGLVLLALIPVLAVQIALSVGLGILLGTLNVFFRDVGQAVGILLQFWFWLTPIVYPISILPDWAAGWIALNPMATLMDIYQKVMVQREIPDLSGFAAVAALALTLLWLGAVVFRRHADEMVDEL